MPAATLLLFCLVLVILPGCASYVSHSVRIKSDLAEGRFEEALEEVDKAGKGASRLLGLYESGLIFHYARDYEQSNQYLHEAELLYDDLYTKSISREVGSLVASDVVLAYRGEPFESAFIHYYKILNFLHLGDGQGALVECRKLNHKLKVFRDAGDTFYTNDPFLQYLTGLVYESEGDLQNAWVSYRVALEAYEKMEDTFQTPPPPSLRCEFQRVGSRLGYADEFPQPADSMQCSDDPTVEGRGEIVLLVEDSFVANKVPVEFVAPILKGDIDDNLDEDDFAFTLADRVQRNRVYPRKVDHWLKIAFPEMVSEPPIVSWVEVVAVEVPASAIRAVPAADLGAVALKRFKERRVAMLAKTFARALAKYLAKQKVEQEKGKLAGLAVNIFNIATETADTRSWSTLPGRIHLARLPLPEGRYTIQVVLRDQHGERLDTIAIPDVEVLSGRTTFLNHRVF